MNVYECIISRVEKNHDLKKNKTNLIFFYFNKIFFFFLIWYIDIYIDLMSADAMSVDGDG